MNQFHQGLPAFIQVAEQKSFTKAAQKLRLSTAQVSRSISQLEKRLNSQLFYRSTRKVVLTEAGELYYHYCHHALAQIQEAENALSNLRQEPEGLLRVTAPVTYGENIIAPLLNDFLSRYEKLRLQLELGNQQEDVIGRGFDLAIRLGKLDDSSLSAKRLADRRQFVCASPAYLQQYGTPHTLDELKKHNCLLGTLPYWRFSENKKSTLLRVQGTLQINSGTALLDAALKGLGIVQLPDYYVQEAIAKQQLVSLLIPYQNQDEAVWAVFPKREFMPLKVRVLLDFLTEQLA